LRYFVTGCAGFIGSNLTDRLLAAGNRVVGYDNLTTGQLCLLETALQHPQFTFVQGDLLQPDRLADAMAGADFVFHLAANADVRFGTHHPTLDLEQNTVATVNVLEAMRRTGVRRIGFSSTGSVYGETPVVPTPELAPIPVQTSLYGASKMAAEGFLQAYAEGFGFEVFIFRFVSILGERYTHGHIFDFVRQLHAHPGHLKVLGNGRQRKSYLYVQDCLDAIFRVVEAAPARVNIFNLGTDGYCTVLDSIGWIAGELGLAPELELSGGERGWIGDNPFLVLDCSRVRALGWAPKFTIRDGVVRTVRYLVAHPELFDLRS
jgi:UDP-glucose 4-epimerase